MLAIVVVIPTPHTIIIVLLFDMFANISTIIIASTVLDICSTDKDFAGISILSFPLKYPFNTEDIAVTKIDGANAFKTSLVSGICKYKFAIVSAREYKVVLPIKPIVPNMAIAIFKILYAPLLSPTANLAEIKLEIAFGTPIEQSVRKIAYTWNAAENIAFPVSANPVLFVKYSLYIIPIIFMIICDDIKIVTFFKKLFFFKFTHLIFKYIY